MRYGFMRFAVLGLAMLAFAPLLGATTFTVTNTNASGAGSFPQAVQDANNDGASPHVIEFNIPGAGVHVITPTFPMAIFRPTTIDGTTQPGFSGMPLVQLSTAFDAIFVRSADVTIRSLAFDSAAGAIVADGLIASAERLKVLGCFFNTDASGTSVPVGQVAGSRGVYVGKSSSGGNLQGVEIGGPGAGDGNRFGRVGTAIYLNRTQSARVDGNSVGIGALSDGSVGVDILQGSTGAIIGERAPNVFTARPAGVVIRSDCTGNSIVDNSFYGNSAGIVFEDPALSNNGQAAPSVDEVRRSASATLIEYTYDNLSAGDYRFQFFSNPVAEQQGRTFVGEETRTINALGAATFQASFPTLVTEGHYITSTVTRVATGDTSRFSNDALVAAASTFTFSLSGYSVIEGGIATITVNRSSGTGVESVDFATAPGTAAAGSDYTSTAGTLVFPDGVTSLTFDVTTLPDPFNEGDETVLLQLSNPSLGGTAGGSATLTIVNQGVGVQVPTASEWALAAMALLLAGVAVVRLR